MFSYNIHNDIPIKEKISLCNASTQTEFSWQAHSLYIEKLIALKKKINVHKQMVNNKLREKEMILKQQTLFIEQQFEALNTKLHQIQVILIFIS